MTQRSDYRDSTVPRHVAIIPDGNRRWASLRGMDPWIGHEQGAQRIEELASAARDMGITHLSFWGSSMENLTKRPLLERKALMNVYENISRNHARSVSCTRGAHSCVWVLA